MAWVGTSIPGCRFPPPYLSLLYQSTSLALVINKKHLNQMKRSTASLLPDAPASLTLTLTSAISTHPPLPLFPMIYVAYILGWGRLVTTL